MGHLREAGPNAFIGAQLILDRIVNVLTHGSEQREGGGTFIKGRNEFRAQSQEQGHGGHEQHHRSAGHPTAAGNAQRQNP